MKSEIYGNGNPLPPGFLKHRAGLVNLVNFEIRQIRQPGRTNFRCFLVLYIDRISVKSEKKLPELISDKDNAIFACGGLFSKLMLINQVKARGGVRAFLGLEIPLETSG